MKINAPYVIYAAVQHGVQAGLEQLNKGQTKPEEIVTVLTDAVAQQLNAVLIFASHEAEDDDDDMPDIALDETPENHVHIPRDKTEFGH